MSGRKITSNLMIAAPFVLMFVVSSILIGLLPALGVFGGVAAILAWLWLAVEIGKDSND